MPPMVDISVPKYVLSRLSESPMLSNILAPRYERMVEIPIFAIILSSAFFTAFM